MNLIAAPVLADSHANVPASQSEVAGGLRGEARESTTLDESVRRSNPKAQTDSRGGSQTLFMINGSERGKN